MEPNFEYIVKDLTDIRINGERQIAEELDNRYSKDFIYTMIGPSILLYLNPLKQLPIYDKNYAALYINNPAEQIKTPHVFGFTAGVYRKMVATQQDQVLITLGETGSGKTENFNHILYCLLKTSPPINKREVKLQQQVNNMFSVLNCFGNAKSSVNPDSSCFSKMVEMQFDINGRFLGCQVMPYLLEKHRLCDIKPEERNFHIFYSLLYGSSNEERNMWKLSDPSKFHYLNKSLHSKIPEIDDKAAFTELKANMKLMGLNSKFQRNIFQLIAAILHLGNIEFVPNTTKSQNSQESALVKNFETVELVADLLGIDAEILESILLNRTIVVKKEICTQFLDQHQAAKVRDSIAKSIYSLLFTWLTEFMNAKVSSENPQNTISIVDFTGFSNYSTNGFDEFFINFANEKLFEFYNQTMFEGPMKEFAEEGIKCEIPKPLDNRSCISLFTNESKGILRILHNETNKGDESKDVDFVVAIQNAQKSNASYFTPQPINASTFGVNHYSGRVTYSCNGFLEKNKDEVSSDIVSLIRGSSNNAGTTNNFLAGLFNEESLIIEKQSNRDRIISVKEDNKPKRQPSKRVTLNPEQMKNATENTKTGTENTKHGTETEGSKKKTSTVATQFLGIITELLDGFKESKIHFLICLNPAVHGQEGFDFEHVTQQVTKYSFVQYIQFIRLAYCYSADFDRFLTEYQALSYENDLVQTNVSSREKTMFLLNALELPSDGYLVTSRKVLFKHPTFKMLQEAFMRKLQQSETEGELVNGLPMKTKTLNGEYSKTYLNASASFDFEDDNMSVAETEKSIESLMSRDIESGKHSLGAIIPMKTINENPKEKAPETKKPEIEEKEETTTQRKIWVAFTYFTTWWIPSVVLSAFGMKNPDVQMAWREKVALCFLICILSGFMLFYIVGLTNLICPPQKVMTPVELAKKPMDQPNVIIKGRIYDLSEFAATHVTNKATSAMIFDVAGLDVSGLFPRKVCNVELTPYNPDCKVKGRSAEYTYCHAQTFMYQELEKYFVGNLGYSVDEVKLGNNPDNALIIINGSVYNVSKLVKGNKLSSAGQRAVMTAPWGKDKTSDFQYSGAAQDLKCLQDYFVGVIDTRQGLNCILADWILIGTTAIVVGVMVFKFLSALQFGGRREPEDLDKFVILQVPCYTEGEESLRKTIDSLAQLKYDDKRKLLFIVADGMIIGSGNDRPTPRIVLDILGVDPDIDPEPQSFISLAEGSRQHNMGKVYSGLYECAGHRVPFVVISKVGRSTERSRPGNRGKRDSQMVLMRFLNKVHYDLPMTPLELTIYRHIKNVIGVDPGYYEYILMVDADTEVLPDSLNRMVSCCIHDSKIMGICGETQIANEKDSWITMIQVYEYYISHHLAKAFESLFGSVTCLPGCFCMYRVKTPGKQSPLIISPLILDDYSVNEVNTLHKKNLLALGEDRYLTTLMMRYFPENKLKFTPDAMCKTVAPDRWSVLLSQRRRWINSTIHNLFELLLLPQLCGFCCFSMRFVVFLDLFATLVMPATIGYLGYLIYQAINTQTAPVISLIMIAAAYGMQTIIFLLKRQWQHIGWMIIYIIAMPIFNFFIPIYAFWHFDDFSWGNTRRVVGEKKGGHAGDDEKFDPSTIPTKKWSEYEQEGWETESHYSKDSARTKKTDASKRTQKTNFTGYSQQQREKSRGLYAVPESTPGMSYSYSTGAIPKSQSAHSIVSASDYYDQNNSRRNLLSRDNSDYLRSTPKVIDTNMVYDSPVFFAGNDYAEQQPKFPSHEEMIDFVKNYLANANLMNVTKKKVRDEMSAYYRVDLTPFKDFINETIELVLQGRL